MNPDPLEADTFIRQFLNKVRVFHFHDTSMTSRMRNFCDASDALNLRDEGGNLAAVTYSGSAPDNIAGVFQVNIQIPTDLTTGIYDVVIKAGNISSTAGVTVAVK